MIVVIHEVLVAMHLVPKIMLIYLRAFSCAGGKIRPLQCPFQVTVTAFSTSSEPGAPDSAGFVTYPQDFVIRNGSQLQVCFLFLLCIITISCMGASASLGLVSEGTKTRR